MDRARDISFALTEQGLPEDERTEAVRNHDLESRDYVDQVEIISESNFDRGCLRHLSYRRSPDYSVLSGYHDYADDKYFCEYSQCIMLTLVYGEWLFHFVIKEISSYASLIDGGDSAEFRRQHLAQVRSVALKEWEAKSESKKLLSKFFEVLAEETFLNSVWEILLGDNKLVYDVYDSDRPESGLLTSLYFERSARVSEKMNKVKSLLKSSEEKFKPLPYIDLEKLDHAKYRETLIEKKAMMLKQMQDNVRLVEKCMQAFEAFDFFMRNLHEQWTWASKEEGKGRIQRVRTMLLEKEKMSLPE